MKTTHRHKLPAIVSYLIRWVCPIQFREHLLGDLEEAYRTIQEESGSTQARAWYWRECLYSLPHLFAHRIINVKWRALFCSTLTGSVAAIATSVGFFLILKSILGGVPSSAPALLLLPLVCSLLCSVAGGFVATLVHGTQNRIVLCLVAMVILLPKIAYVMTVGHGLAELIVSIFLVFLGLATGVHMLRVIQQPQ